MPSPAPPIVYHHQHLGIANGVYAVIREVTISKSNEELRKLSEDTVRSVLSYSEHDLQNDVVQGYEELLREFGAADLVPASKNWVNLIRTRGTFINISTAVDAYNIVAAKSFLAFGAHDLDKVKGTITFDTAREGETITPVNSSKSYATKVGDYVYRDEEKILAWLDVRDCDAAKITLDTRNILLVVEGNRRTSYDFNKGNLENACQLITRFCGGRYEIAPLCSE